MSIDEDAAAEGVDLAREGRIGGQRPARTETGENASD